jgi:1-acyl-sn-glycerol-3-phosphate acyltransferase
MKTFAKIRFYYGAAVISIVVAAIMIPLVYLFPSKKGTIMHTLNRFILKLLGARIKTTGARDENANLFLFNHQGIIDIIVMEAVENTHMGWVAKKELFDIPIYGNLLKYGEMISVDRSNRAGLIKLLRDAKELITQKHRAIAIFPEGTRARDQKLLPFKAGTQFMADKLHLRIQPVVITGSKQLLNEHIRTAHNATVNVIYLDAFDADKAPESWYKDLRKTMQSVIDKEFEQYGHAR